MSAKPLRLLFVVRDQSERIRRIADHLQDCVLACPQGEVVGSHVPDALPCVEDVADLVVVIGGDGTILRTCRQLAHHQRPIIGVNMGKLGFLADLSPEEFERQVPNLVRGEYRVLHHLMFACTLHRGNEVFDTYLGLNEVAVLSAGSLQMLRIGLVIDSEPVTTYSGDGLIVSTPVGSTAHSLAAGGPILRQDLEAFVITPISPHTLTNRPLVDRADCRYELVPLDVREGVTLVVDGQIKQPLQPGDRIEVRRAPVTFQLVRLAQHSFYGTLHRKLGWGGQPNYELPPE